MKSKKNVADIPRDITSQDKILRNIPADSQKAKDIFDVRTVCKILKYQQLIDHYTLKLRDLATQINCPDLKDEIFNVIENNNRLLKSNPITDILDKI